MKTQKTISYGNGILVDFHFQFYKKVWIEIISLLIIFAFNNTAIIAQPSMDIYTDYASSSDASTAGWSVTDNSFNLITSDFRIYGQYSLGIASYGAGKDWQYKGLKFTKNIDISNVNRLGLQWRGRGEVVGKWFFVRLEMTRSDGGTKAAYKAFMVPAEWSDLIFTKCDILNNWTWYNADSYTLTTLKSITIYTGSSITSQSEDHILIDGLYYSDNPTIEDQQFPIGFYDAAKYPLSGNKIANEGGNIILNYSFYSTTAQIQEGLDKSLAAGMKVIMEIPPDYIQNMDTTSIQSFCQTWGSHPAVYGWASADEPSNHSFSVTECETAYNAIKAVSSKPVFMVFWNNEVDAQQPIAYQNSYDIMMVDPYPFQVGDEQFIGLEGFFNPQIWSIKNQAQQIGKPWWLVPQAFGECPTAGWNYRLPTKRELKYMTYYGIFYGARGLLYWAHYRTEETTANLSCPYPNSGLQWLIDVWEPLADEFALCGNAIAAGSISYGVCENNDMVVCDHYLDPVTGEYYIVAINTYWGDQFPVFSIDLPINVLGLDTLSSDRSFITLDANGQFSDKFQSYDVHIYRVIEDLN